jgi:hypothetical protein
MPKLLLVIIPGCIRLDISLQMELLVELLKKDTFLERPTRRIPDSIHIPAFSYDAILYHSRIADERIDAIRSHHRHRVTVIDSGCGMLLNI